MKKQVRQEVTIETIMSTTKLRRFPDGKETSSLEKYFEEWDKIIIPIEKALGLCVIGYDPGVLFSDPMTKSVLQLSADLAIRLAKALKVNDRV